MAAGRDHRPGFERRLRGCVSGFGLSPGHPLLSRPPPGADEVAILPGALLLMTMETKIVA